MNLMAARTDAVEIALELAHHQPPACDFEAI